MTGHRLAEHPYRKLPLTGRWCGGWGSNPTPGGDISRLSPHFHLHVYARAELGTDSFTAESRIKRGGVQGDPVVWGVGGVRVHRRQGRLEVPGFISVVILILSISHAVFGVARLPSGRAAYAG